MSEASYKVHRIGLHNVSSFLIYRPGEAILVDCGNSGSEVKILEVFKKLGLEPEMLKLLVLTHSHFDHAGSAGRLKELTADPDLMVDDQFDLEPYGFPGRVIHAPGHTFGSMLVLMKGGELIAGDTLFGVEDKQHFPPFAEDLPALVRTWKYIHELPVKTFYPAHGRYFSMGSFLAEYESAMKRYG